MTTIKTSCPLCGDIELTPPKVRLTVPPEGRGWFSFECPTCKDGINRTAGAEEIALLATAGVLPEVVPAEVWETHEGPPITWDDVLDLHEELDAMEVGP